MAQWGNEDSADQSVLWAPSAVKLAPTRANANAMYGNTTANSFVSGATVGMFGADELEVGVTAGIPHTGWVLRTEGSGGRANRVQYEVLVAGSMTTDNDDDDTTLPDA
jgi:hypothetical protein